MVPMGHARPYVLAEPSELLSGSSQFRLCMSGTATEVGAMGEYLDLRVHDLVALDEIELYAEVLSAVAASDRPLTLAELDECPGRAALAAGSVCTS